MKLMTKRLLATSLLLSTVLVTIVVAKDAIKAKVPEKKVEKTVTVEGDVQVFTADNKDGKITPKTIEEAFKKAGFFVSANRDMNTPFKKQFKETSFDVYNLFTYYKKDTVLELAKKYENIGLFAPMSMSIYTKKGEKTISISTLSAEAMAKIMKMPKDEKILTDLRALVVETLKSALPNGKFDKLPYKIAKAPGELVTTFEMEMDKDEWEDELEEFKMGFEGELSPNGFVIAGQNNLGDDFEEKDYEGYDFYEVYSVCKLPVIFTIAKSRPEAGAFAPCSLYLAKKKDAKNMKAGFPSVYNWMSSLAITDKNDLDVLEDAQKRMKKILTSLTE
jgi:uncharacterized protein (DUF302 family)